MATGDKVLALLGAKALCRGSLALAATGALGGLGVWLTDDVGRWFARLSSPVCRCRSPCRALRRTFQGAKLLSAPIRFWRLSSRYADSGSSSHRKGPCPGAAHLSQQEQSMHLLAAGRSGRFTKETPADRPDGPFFRLRLFQT